METNTNSSEGHFLKNLEDFFHKLYVKVPWHLPAKAKEFIVKVGPWITLIVMIFALPVILGALGMATFLAPFAAMYGGYHVGLGFLLGGIVTLASFLFEIAALPGLFSRSLQGWRFVYYAALLSALADLLRFDIVGLIIGLAISLYILFEIKQYYK